jgi:hypothetical protein
VFGGTAVSFSENICLFLTGTKQEDILFWSAGEYNKTGISGAEQPIKLREEHYSPPGYMLIK